MSAVAKSKTVKPSAKPAAKGTALVARATRPPAIQTRPPVNMLEVISRAAADPKTDVDKLERLMAMAERAKAKEAEQAFNVAMAEAQKEMKRIGTDKENTHTKTQYASYAQLDRAIRPIYSRHGFALSFDTGDNATPEHVRVVCHVLHNGGHSRDYRADIPCDGKGAQGKDVMTKTHAMGSALSYGSRYLLKLIFNVAVGEDDDDGNGANGTGPITEEQAETILDMLTRDKADVQLFCKSMKIESIIQLPATRYREAIERINTRSQIVKQKDAVQ